MSDDAHLRVLRSPRFQELVRRRAGFAWTLSVIMLVIYFGFIALVAFAKPLLAVKVGGGVTSLGIVLGLVVIVAAFVLTGIYARRANGEFDALTARLKEEVRRCGVSSGSLRWRLRPAPPRISALTNRPPRRARSRTRSSACIARA